MSIEYKQAFNAALGAGSNTLYTTPTGVGAQIRAATIHNPTVAPIACTVLINSIEHIAKTITAGSTVILSELLNHQVSAGQAVTATGNTLTLILSVAEVT